MAINDYGNVVENQVIKYLRKKDSDPNDFGDITWLGAEQRFVSPIRHSSLNNLEEQLIIGTDTYTITENDLVGNEVEEKYFCPLENATDITNARNYYLMRSITYKNGAGQHYSFDDTTHTLVLSNYMNDSRFDDDHQTVIFTNSGNYSTFVFDENNELNIEPETIDTRQQVLYYITDGNIANPLPIISKITAIMNAETGIEGHPTRKVVREKIINWRAQHQQESENAPILDPDSGNT